MIPLSSVVSTGLTWSKVSHQDYELKVNGKVVGTLHRPSFWSSTVLAETQSGCWTFRRHGWLGAGAQILDSNSQQEIATFKSSWSGAGTLAFADGQTFHLECKGWWRPVWSVIAQTGETLLRLHTREKEVEVTAQSAVTDSRLSLLIMFTWYRVLQAEEDAAATAIAAAS
ncbi:MAG TPA: hypothetical protein VGU64_23510 [Terriglobales bacterium]|nr:hypothetical protein [Terriglobales bacterium]